ncbi:MAG: magnesium transporter [Lachnospiraceae bacterium]|uniref:magnesium transporter n=1 Tax=Galactobacillus timonensis TaxID=2041840 RepID=UPI0023EF6353|nr:magnesium transporter [Galactobacillus timonensis]MCI6754091.1 magnesium transporter [Galactobacillus timonensis]MDD7087915.1 magnesium transporter [Galactobacillus timonensis]MDY5223307.1 magnesium transporter [Lachnospiraceae bacterium]
MSEPIDQRHLKEILQIIETTDQPEELRDKLDDYHEYDIGAVLPQLTREERIKLVRSLDLPRLADIYEYLDTEDAEDYLEELPDDLAARILSAMEVDDAVDFLKNTVSEKKESWLSHMNIDVRENLTKLAAYEEDTIASRMTTNFITVQTGSSVPEAMKQVVAQAATHDNISTIYAVNEKGIFAGAFSLKDLIIARKDTPLSDIIVTAYPSVYATEKIADVLSLIENYSEESIPVLSRDNKILGVVTASDVVEVVDDEMGDDYAKLGGLGEEEDLNEPVKESVRKRLPWLILLLFLGMLVSSVVSAYETVVARLTLIMAFQSMILDMSGNVGTQSLAVTIRVLMDENLQSSAKGKLLRKEMETGLLNGLILGIIAFAGVGFYIVLAKHYPLSQAFLVSGCIGASLVLAMFISSMVGTVVPMFFKKIGVDPAVASGPLITTITDLVGVVTYYSLAWMMLDRFTAL